MASDFAATLAQMIAQARPQQAPPQQRPQVIPGPEGLMSNRREFGFKAQVDLDPIMKMLNIMTPEQKDKAAENWYQGWKDSVGDEQTRKLMSTDPKNKALWDMAAKRGYPVIRNPDGTMAFADETPEAAARKFPPTPASVGSGLHGERAMTNLRETTALGIQEEKKLSPEDKELYGLKLQVEKARLASIKSEDDMRAVLADLEKTNKDLQRQIFKEELRLKKDASIDPEVLDYIGETSAKYFEYDSKRTSMKDMDKDTSPEGISSMLNDIGDQAAGRVNEIVTATSPGSGGADGILTHYIGKVENFQMTPVPEVNTGLPFFGGKEPDVARNAEMGEMLQQKLDKLYYMYEKARPDDPVLWGRLLELMKDPRLGDNHLGMTPTQIYQTLRAMGLNEDSTKMFMERGGIEFSGKGKKISAESPTQSKPTSVKPKAKKQGFLDWPMPKSWKSKAKGIYEEYQVGNMTPQQAVEALKQAYKESGYKWPKSWEGKDPLEILLNM